MRKSKPIITDLEKLDLFLERCDELFSTKFVKDSKATRLSLKMVKGVFTYQLEDEPDEENLKSFLLSFRHFVSNDEPVYLPIIYNILQLRLPDCELKESLKVSRELWKSANEVASLQLVRSKIIPSKPGKTEDSPVTPKDIWDMWINGKYFHNDTEKKADLISFAGWAEGLVKYGFIDYLIKVTKEINYVELAIREALVMHKSALTP